MEKSRKVSMKDFFFFQKKEGRRKKKVVFFRVCPAAVSCLFFALLCGGEQGFFKDEGFKVFLCFFNHFFQMFFRFKTKLETPSQKKSRTVFETSR
jgi:hypothetical protein